jgi:membrane protein
VAASDQNQPGKPELHAQASESPRFMRWIHETIRPSAWLAVARKVLDQCNLAEAVDMAAQVSFYFALSCFPFLIVLAALLGWFHGTSSWQSFWFWLTNYLPASAQVTVMTLIVNLSKGFKGFLSFGLFASLWSASSGFQSLMDALSHVYGGRETRSYVYRRLVAIAATVCAAAFLVFSFGLLSVGRVLAVFAARYSLYAVGPWKIARWSVTLVVLLVGVDLINYFFPARHPPWRLIMPGSALSVICFLLGSAVLNSYLVYSNHSMSRVYGTLTGFIAIMFWIYVLSLSLLFGAQTDAAILRMRPGDEGQTWSSAPA